MRKRERDIKVCSYRGVQIYRSGRWYYSEVSPLEWSSTNTVMNEIDETFGFKLKKPQINFYITQEVKLDMN